MEPLRSDNLIDVSDEYKELDTSGFIDVTGKYKQPALPANLIDVSSEYSIDASKMIDVSGEYTDKIKPPQATFSTKLKEIKERPAQLVPFLSSIDEMGYYLKLGDALNRLKQSIAEEERVKGEKADMAAYGEAVKRGETIGYTPKQIEPDRTKAIAPKVDLGPLTKEDLELLKDFQDKNTRDTTFGYKVLDVLSHLPAFAGEMAATSGVYSAGSKGAREGLEWFLKKGGKELVNKKLTQTGLKVAGGIAGGTLQTVPAGALRIAAEAQEKMLPEYEIDGDKAHITKEGEKPFEAVTQAAVDQWVETVSEHGGGLLEEAARYLPERVVNNVVVNAIKKLNPMAKSETLRKIAESSAWHGVWGEMFEERLADIGHAVLGQGELKLPTAEQLLVEFTAFSIPGVAGRALEKVSGAKEVEPPEAAAQKPKAKKVTLTPVEDILKEGEAVKKEYQAKKRGEKGAELPQAEAAMEPLKTSAAPVTMQEVVYDKEDIQGVAGGEQEGEAAVKAEPELPRGAGEAIRGGEVQTYKEKAEVKERPRGIVPTEEIWDKSLMDIQQEWYDAVSYTEERKEEALPKIKALQEEMKGLKGKENVQRKKVLGAEIERLKQGYEGLFAEYENAAMDEFLKLKEEAIEKARARGLTDEDRLQEFADEFLMESSTERPYVEYNYNKTVQEIFDETLGRYLPEGVVEAKQPEPVEGKLAEEGELTKLKNQLADYEDRKRIFSVDEGLGINNATAYDRLIQDTKNAISELEQSAELEGVAKKEEGAIIEGTEPVEEVIPPAMREGGEDVDIKRPKEQGEPSQVSGGAEEAGAGALEAIPAKALSGAKEERGVGKEPEPGGKADLRRDERDRSSVDREERLHEATGRGRGVGDAEGGVDTSARGRGGERAEKRRTASRNYRIKETDLPNTFNPKQRYKDNIAAIQSLKKIESENRTALPEEQETLAKYAGWGGIPQVFDQWNDEWQSEREELSSLLTEDEFEAARASTPNAHYTSSEVIKGIWNILEKMGFQGGRVLEPSMGVGNFFGLMPEHIEGASKLTGVELDAITGRISKQLYPDADIRVQGFEEAKLPDNFYDVSVSNVPFGDYKLHDPRYNKYRFNIHDYFFAKAIDKTRPGGVVAFITSRYTMDKADPKVRKYLYDRADLVFSVRLPNTAFLGNANTEVTTDVIFLKKRKEGEGKKGAVWVDTELAGPAGSEFNLNEYYVKNPEMMLGEMAVKKHGMYGKNEPYLKPSGKSIEDELKRIEGIAPQDVIQAAVAGRMEEPAVQKLPAPGEIKEGAFAVKDGRLYKNEGGELTEVSASLSTKQRIEGMIGIRDAVKALLRKEMTTANDEDIKPEMKALNKTYDDFVRKWGYVNARANSAAFGEDPDYPRLLALERWDEEKRKAEKEAIFFKRVNYPVKRIEKTETAKEALVVSLNEYGKVNFERMSELTGKTVETLQTELLGLVYKNPEGGWETADEYLSGNVRKKLEIAEGAAKADNKAYQQNVEALKAVQPEPLKASDIDTRLGAPWIPASDIESFIKKTLNLYGYSGDIKVRYAPAIGTWTIEKRRAAYVNTVENTKTWGTDRYNALELIQDALNHKLPTVRDKVEDKTVINVKETEAAREKQYQLKERFKEWVWEDSERRERLVNKYNEEFNNIRVRKFDGGHLTLPGMASDITLMPHQKDAIWRGIQNGKALLAHVVGAGKTWVMAGTAMEARRLGLAKKPLFVVPNHLVGQWGAEFIRLYPNANILVAGKEDFTPLKRKTLMSRISSGDWDAVIVAHSSFEKLPMSDEAYAAFIQEQIDILESHILEAREEDVKGSRIVKELEKAKKRLEAKLKARLNIEAKDITISFEELGVDMLFVDEAHLFKNLFFPTKMTRVAGVPATESNRANDLFMKSQWLLQRNKGKGVVFATGTPVSNSMAEMFTMQRYLQPEVLDEYGIGHFDAWAANFGEVVSSLELAPEGTGYRVKSRFARFTNLPELVQMFRQVADVQTAEMLKLPVPKLSGGKAKAVVAKASEDLKGYLKKLLIRAEQIRQGKVAPYEDNMLAVTTDGRKAALDMRLIDPALEDYAGSKVNLAVANIYDVYKKTRGTQLVFSDLSTPDKTAFNVYHDMRDKLGRAGIPKEEIAFIHDADTDVKKKQLFDKVNEGKVRVLLGSTAKMGAGVNVQKRLIALHHLDAPWRPSDIEQREGRILRQGNDNSEVEIYRYVTEESFDAYIWQILENKARFIAQVMTNKVNARAAEDVEGAALTYAEVKALASGNPLVMEKIKVDIEARRLQTLYAQYKSQLYDMQAEIAGLPEKVEGLKGRIKQVRADAEKREMPEEFAIEIEGKEYDERAKAGMAILKIANKMRGVNEERRIGRFAGFDLYLKSYEYTFLQPNLILRGEFDHTANVSESDKGTVQSLEYAAKNMGQQAEAFGRTLGEWEDKLQKLEDEVKKPFQFEGKLKEIAKKQEELNKKLDLDKDEATEGVEEEEKGEAGVTLDFMGGQQIYEATMKLLKRVNPKAGENVNVQGRKKDIGIVSGLLASPGRIEGKARYYVVHAKNAVHKQDRLRGLFDDKMKGILKPLKGKDEISEFEAISWMGDAEGKNYTEEELTEMGVSPVVKDVYLKHRRFHRQVWNLLSAHRKAYGAETGRREGHIPHFFENWNVYEVTEKEVETEEGFETDEAPGKIVGTFRSMNEAVNFANGLSPEQKYIIKPKAFKMPEALLDKSVLKDTSYRMLADKLENTLQLTREEAQELASEVARRKNRHRLLGNLMKRQGQTGFKKADVPALLQQYYNSVARYLALDDFKARVVPKFEKDFGVELGRASQALRDKNTARYVEEYINNVNGVPGMLEDLLDASIKRAFGGIIKTERPTIWTVNKLLHFTATMKLGLFNISAGMVNLTQMFNTFAKVPVKHFEWAFHKAWHMSESEKAILKRIGIPYDIGLSDTGGYSVTHKGGRITAATMVFFRGAESINRRVTALAAYRYARKDLGYGEQKARQYVRELVDKTQYDYSVADTARLFRNPAGRLFGQFKPFAIKQIEFITGLRGPEHVKFWVPMLLMAGMLGIPLIEGISEIIEWLTGKDPLIETKKWLIEWAGDDKEKQRVAEIAMYGVASQVGVDISRRVGIGDVLPKRFEDLLGPTINTLRQAKRIMESGDRTEFVKNLAPSVGNLLTAIETAMNDMEVRDPYHRERLKYAAEPGEVAVKGAGLRPLRETKMADIEQIRQYEGEKYTKKQQGYIDGAIEALQAGDAEGFVKAITRAAEEGVIIDDKAIENEMLQKLLPQDMRMLLKTRAIQRGDYMGTLDFMREAEAVNE